MHKVETDYLVILKLGFLITFDFPIVFGNLWTAQSDFPFNFIDVYGFYLLVAGHEQMFFFNLVFQIEAPVHSSNVMLYSKEQNVASRVGHKILEDGTRARYLIKTGEIIDTAENWKRLKEENTKTEVAVAS